MTIRWDTVAAIAAGGMLGAMARSVIGLPVDSAVAGLGLDILGAATIGVLMTFINEIYPDRRLLRPMVSVGTLGGFTLASTYAVDMSRLVSEGKALSAAAYLIVTVFLVLGATCAGLSGAERALRSRVDTQGRRPRTPSERMAPEGGLYGSRSAARATRRAGRSAHGRR